MVEGSTGVALISVADNGEVCWCVCVVVGVVYVVLCVYKYVLFCV